VKVEVAMQPSQCKMFNGSKETIDSSECDEEEIRRDLEEEQEEASDNLEMKGETIEVVDGAHVVQTVVINGQQYQILSPGSMDSMMVTHPSSTSPQPFICGTSPSQPQPVHYKTSVSPQSQASRTSPSPQTGSAVQYPATINQIQRFGNSAPPSGSGIQRPVILSAATQHQFERNGMDQVEDQSRKREIRLLKNKEAARECRNKKKEYIKCLENRVAVLENQNTALIEELKTLKELYTGQKN